MPVMPGVVRNVVVRLAILVICVGAYTAIFAPCVSRYTGTRVVKSEFCKDAFFDCNRKCFFDIDSDFCIITSNNCTFAHDNYRPDIHRLEGTEMLRIFAYFHTRTDNDDAADELIKELTLIGKLCFLFAVDTVRFIINFTRLYFYWLLLAAVVFVLYASREVVLEVMHYAGIITLDIASIVDKIVGGIIGVLNDLADALNAVTFGAVSVHINGINVESKLGAMEDAKDMINICDSIDTMWSEVFHTLKLNTHKVCSVVRYMYPIDFVYAPLDTILGWMIFDPRPVGQPGCKSPRFYMLCYIFNFYQMIKFISFALFYFTLIKSYIRTINFFFEHFLFQIISITLRLIREVFITLWHLIHRKKGHTRHFRDTLADILSDSSVFPHTSASAIKHLI